MIHRLVRTSFSPSSLAFNLLDQETVVVMNNSVFFFLWINMIIVWYSMIPRLYQYIMTIFEEKWMSKSIFFFSFLSRILYPNFFLLISLFDIVHRKKFIVIVLFSSLCLSLPLSFFFARLSIDRKTAPS